MSIVERVQKLRNFMKENNIKAYIIPSADYHQSEYVGDYFKCRQYISGFTGSAGTVVVMENEAGLWTDGRYFVQADKELKGTGISLFKMGEEGVLPYEEYIYSKLNEGDTLGFYGKVVGAKEGLTLKQMFAKKNISIVQDIDLIDKVWTDRPAMANKKAFALDNKQSGESVKSKLERLRKDMISKGATINVISTLDDIAWLLNIRGGDVAHNPVVLAYAIVGLKDAHLFVEKSKLSDEISNSLKNDGITIHSYDEFDASLKSIKPCEKVLIDLSKINYSIFETIDKDVIKIDALNPTTVFKAQKNEVELENLRNSHIKDGVAVTKFMHWIKNNIGKIEITELSAGAKMLEFRKEQEGFIEASFNTITAYRGNAAMPHYAANEESDVTLEPKDLYLIDSGGQYTNGTTDITRTMALGPIKDEVKTHFTLVLKGMINLSMTKFLYGATGHQLDAIARRPIWNNAINYNHGTGHGIGFLLNVHEGPHSIRFQPNPTVLEEGMVVSNEPGIYVENSHGIRIENEIIVKKGPKNDFGQFMEFEVLTFAPIDLDAVDVSLLNEEEKAYLNWYHKMVFDKVSKYLDENQVEWLKNYTRAI